MGCLFYTLLPYRLGLLYCSGDLGSGAALAVLPLMFAGFFELYGREEGADKRLWILLSVLYTLLFQLQILDFLVAAVFNILLMLCFWKKTFRKDMLLTLGKTVVGFCILNGWLFVKLFYFFRQGQLPLYFAGNGKIQSRGVYFSNFLHVVFCKRGKWNCGENGNAAVPAFWNRIWSYLLHTGLSVALFCGKKSGKEAGEKSPLELP